MGTGVCVYSRCKGSKFSIIIVPNFFGYKQNLIIINKKKILSMVILWSKNMLYNSMVITQKKRNIFFVPNHQEIFQR